MALPKAKKKKAPRTNRRFDTKYIGDEPAGKDLTAPADLQKAVAWHQYFGDAKAAHKYAVEYFESDHVKGCDGSVLKQLKELDPKYMSFILRLGWYCRLIMKGNIVDATPSKEMMALTNQLPELLEKQKTDDEEKKERSKYRRTSSSIAQSIITELEDEIDKFDGSPMTISVASLVTKYSASPAQSKQVGKYFMDYLDELNELLALDYKIVDPYYKKLYQLQKKSWTVEVEQEMTEHLRLDYSIQLLEGYRHYDKKQQTNLRDLVKSIVDGAGYVATTMKTSSQTTQPMVKVKKSKPAGQQVKSMRFQKSDDSLKLASLAPVAAIGKRRIWAWNTKYKQIICWEAADGFEASGSTWKGVTSSKARTVRKPEEFFKDGWNGTATRRNTMFDSLKTTIREMPGRMNENIVLLAFE